MQHKQTDQPYITSEHPQEPSAAQGHKKTPERVQNKTTP